MINNPKKIAGTLMAMVSLTLLYAFVWPVSHVTVYLAGDSTMADKEVKAYPETGWGMPFRAFFDSTVTVVNKAKNGRSTKSFIAEGLWRSITANLKEGDYVFIQFGHNDEVPTKATYTPEADFKTNLVKFIAQTRDRKATPVLITPVARRKFSADGHVEETHAVYAAIVRKVAEEQNVPLIDLDKESQVLIENLGPENSKLLFNYVAPGEHPNYPAGKADDTHFNELGARKMAQIVLEDVKKLHLPLADRIVKGK
jgi:lysophospholipase L1-like esterase